MIGRLAEFVRGRRDGAAAEPNSDGHASASCGRCSPSRSARRSTSCWCSARCWRATPTTSWTPSGPRWCRRWPPSGGGSTNGARRKQPPLQRVIRALLGFDAKMSQYTRGKAFVDDVVAKVGMKRFNTIWTSPETLPLPTEVDEPQRWIDRVL